MHASLHPASVQSATHSHCSRYAFFTFSVIHSRDSVPIGESFLNRCIPGMVVRPWRVNICDLWPSGLNVISVSHCSPFVFIPSSLDGLQFRVLVFSRSKQIPSSPSGACHHVDLCGLLQRPSSSLHSCASQLHRWSQRLWDFPSICCTTISAGRPMKLTSSLLSSGSMGLVRHTLSLPCLFFSFPIKTGFS